eukprot:COSAG02_NODE_21372_length_790_cov_21.923300_1_plen_180_part_10
MRAPSHPSMQDRSARTGSSSSLSNTVLRSVRYGTGLSTATRRGSWAVHVAPCGSSGDSARVAIDSAADRRAAAACWRWWFWRCPKDASLFLGHAARWLALLEFERGVDPGAGGGAGALRDHHAREDAGRGPGGSRGAFLSCRPLLFLLHLLTRPVLRPQATRARKGLYWCQDINNESDLS